MVKKKNNKINWLTPIGQQQVAASQFNNDDEFSTVNVPN